jgi:hypothetical protein
MIYFKIINLFNKFILLLFGFIYNWSKIESIEDKYHSEKVNNNKLMNKFKIEFAKKDEYNQVKQNVLIIIQNHEFLSKYDISTDSILNKTNNKLFVSFEDASITIYICFNHYYISGPTMFILLNKIFDSKPPKFLKTNPFLGIIYLPFYLFDLMSLQKKYYLKNENQQMDLIVEKDICTTNKRYHLYLSILRTVYQSLNLNRPIIAGLTVAFDELSYLKNNVGLVIIKYEITDTIETLGKKIQNASYQTYVSNFIINCPLPSYSYESCDLRNYLDCIISSMYIKSDCDFKVAWNCAKHPLEQMYVGSVSIIRSDNKMDINMGLNTRSSNYKKPDNYNCIENFIHF